MQEQLGNLGESHYMGYSFEGAIRARLVFAVILLSFPIVLTLLDSFNPPTSLVLFILLLIAPYLILNDAMRLYTSISNELFLEIEKACPHLGEGLRVKEGLIYEFNIFYNSKLLGLEIIVLFVITYYVTTKSILMGAHPINMLIFAFVLAIILSHWTYSLAYPDIEPKMSLKAFGYLDMFESFKGRLKIALFMLSYIYLLLTFFRGEISSLIIGDIGLQVLLIITFLIFLYLVFKGIRIVTIASRRIHNGSFLLFSIFAFISIFAGISYMGTIQGGELFLQLEEQQLFVAMFLNYVLAVLLSIALIIKNLNMDLVQVLTRSEKDYQVILQNVETNRSIYTIYLPVNMFLILVSIFILTKVPSYQFNSIFLLYYEGLTLFPYYIVIGFYFVVFLNISKLYNLLQTEFLEIKKRCRERLAKKKRLEERKAKLKEIKEKKKKKTKKRKIIEADEIEAYLKEFDEIFEGG